MGKLLDRMTRAMGRRLPINVLEGNRRPEKPVQAAKLASEGGIAIRQGVPILTHWKEYKKDDDVIDNFMGTLAVSTFFCPIFIFNSYFMLYATYYLIVQCNLVMISIHFNREGLPWTRTTCQ